jgi:predicted transporter
VLCVPQGAETSAPRLTVLVALPPCPCCISGEAMAPTHTSNLARLLKCYSP